MGKAGEEIVKERQGTNLLLCWPPPDSDMAYNALKNFESAKGDFLIYIGDPASSAEPEFFRALEKHFLKTSITIPSWKGINERLFIYKLRN